MMETATEENAIDSILPTIYSAVAEWRTKQNHESIKKKVTAKLDASSQEVTMKLLGFDSSYGGEWSLDHCNGRAGDSAAGNYLRNAQQEAIEEWLSKVKLPDLTATQLKTIKHDLSNDYRSRLKERLRQLILSKAENDASDIIRQMADSLQIENYLKAQRLIEPTNKRE